MKKRTVINLCTKRCEINESVVDLLERVFEDKADDHGSIDENGRFIPRIDGKFDPEAFQKMLWEFLNDDKESDMDALYADIDDDDATEIMTEADFITDSDGNVEISYEESEISGMQGTVCRIVFNRNQPDIVSMIREGSVNTMLSFEEGKRHKSEYNTPYMPFNLAINTLEVDNRILENGELYLNYVIEIRGLGNERCTVRLKVGDMTEFDMEG